MRRAMTEQCPFCRARVPRGTLGYHYAGYQQEPCPDVTFAFGPAEPRVYGPGPQLPPDSWEQGSEARQPCAVPGCREPVYRAGRCLEHRRELVKRQRERDRAKAKARESNVPRPAGVDPGTSVKARGQYSTIGEAHDTSQAASRT